ncbi:MAG: hypothetical protein NTX43_10815 [Bacteroidetes bacterium]|nr:hypothetical protein [Bacteroidota bacterium]
MSENSDTMLMNILQRRSVRNFTVEIIDRSLLMTLLKAAMAGP